MRPVFFPYKLGSASAKLLAKEFGAERVRPNGEFRNNFKRPIINWGNSQVPNWMNKWQDQVILNHPNSIKMAANKLLSYQMFSDCGVKCPEWHTDANYVNDVWMDGDGKGKGCTVIARTTLVGKGGEGIEIYDPNIMTREEDGVNFDQFNFEAPLYTKYFKKKYEYRVHVVRGKVIDFSLKKKREGIDVNYQVRNHEGGWVFCREGVILPECVSIEAVKAVEALGLDFGAVDVGYNEKKDEPCVFEVNSAPGITGTTLESYVKAFKEILG